ncbi:MAG: peptidyl-tRNA hydrolase [Lachnospiraceae bacterium]|nr:peptidyl-tRNA hydrolase [Lachnospiraceae bacterium]
MRQLIIARKDLNMSPGKLAAQVSHASMAFISAQIREKAEKIWKYDTLPAYQEDPFTGEVWERIFKRADLSRFAAEAREEGQEYFTCRPVNPDEPLGELERCENEYDTYAATVMLPRDVFEEWFCGIFTKTICEAKNRNQLLKAVTMAEELGLKENEDFFLIKDSCLTELEPEEIDDDGIGRTLTAIGFRPLSDDIAHQISRKYQLYR